jgi:hypothetical protein
LLEEAIVETTPTIIDGSRRDDGRGHHRGGGCPRPAVAALLTALAAATALAACGRDDGCEPYCGNPIDAIVVPKLRAIGVAPRKVDPFEHCRRIAIDLLGRGPTGSEIEACIEASPERRVELAQASPDYVRAAHRTWGEVLGYDVLEIWSRDLSDLDDLVTELAEGQLDYADFAGQVVTHPGFLGLHYDAEWAAALYRVFLGRPAREDEVAALRPLSIAWQGRYLCEGAVWWNLYQGYLEEETPAEARASANLDCADAAKVNFGFNPCLCQPDDGHLGCYTEALGVPVVFDAVCADPSDPYEYANVMQVGASAPGLTDECPDGTHDAGCRDREVDDDFLTTFPIEAWRPIDAAGRTALDGIGVALAARTDFWEAAVDRELRRLTGWWQASFRHPDSDLPEVRAVLADRLRDGASLRDIEVLIMTSQLYAAPAATSPDWRDDETDPPPWAAGPTKLLAADAWLDTAMLAVGEQPGTCDRRNITVYGYEYELGDPRFLDDPESSLDGVADAFYIEAVTALGGCKAGSPRPMQSNVGLVFAQGEHARTVCAYGDEAVPRNWDGELASAANHLVRRLFARLPVDDEIDELVDDMQACLDAGACADADTAARWLCQRLADSTEFSTY